MINLIEKPELAERREVSLEEIFAEGNIILVDGSITGKGHGICKEIYKAKRYSHINSGIIADALFGISHLHEILSRQNAFTLEKVSDEIEYLVRYLGEKRAYLDKKDKRSIKYYQESSQKESLKNLHNESFRTLKLARSKNIRKAFLIDNEKCGKLVEMIKMLDMAIGLKKDVSYEVYGEHDSDRSHDKDTDEWLVATSFFLSMYTDKKPVLVTSDTDFPRIMGVIPKLIGSTRFLPFNSRFTEALKENPVRLYFRDEKGYKSSINTRELDYCFNPIVNNVSPNENQIIMTKIDKLWQEFD